MKITLDHNCIIHLEQQTAVGRDLKKIVACPTRECFVVNIGASEMLERGVSPDNYGKFEDLLRAAQLEHLPRLNPIGIWDVTFWNHCCWASGESGRVTTEIAGILFPQSQPPSLSPETRSAAGWKKFVNRVCDVQTMWCHIDNGNDVFLTTDKNFLKATKLPRLLRLGAKRICEPQHL